MTDTISHTDAEIVSLVIDSEAIETTREHPFYTDDGLWIEAAALEPGDQIYSLDGDYGTVETVAIVSQPQAMYNLTVDEAHTFFVGDGAWLAHNSNACPLPLEVANWPNRQQGAPRGLLPGIYEYRSGGRPDGRIYVGQSWGQSLQGRLRGKLSNFGRNWNNVVSSSIDFPDEAAARVAERVRIEQLLAMPEVGIAGVANATADRISKTATRAEAIAFMNSGAWMSIGGWPSWLRPPENMIELPEGWN